MFSLVLVIVSELFFSAGFVFAYPNEPEGFREIKWQTDKQSLSGLQKDESNGSFAIYWREKDDLNFEGRQATRILYGFTADHLESVFVKFEPCEAECASFLKKKFIEKYGPGQPEGENAVVWQGEKTSISLNTGGNGVEITFLDASAFTKKFSNMAAFNSKFKAKWDEFLSLYDAETAAGKIKEWLGQEGKDILDSFDVSPQGKQISLHFKGAGNMLFTPSPQNSPRPTASQNVYSVAEALTILQNDPQQFRDKDILLRAVVVDGVMGFGCEDFYLLTDAKNADLYSRRIKGNLTPEEQKKFDEIPLISSGPTLAMPKTTFGENGQEKVFRGHFFDNSMKPCGDGWKRFIITGNG